MSKSNILKFATIISVIFLLTPFSSYSGSRSENFKLFTDAIDQSGGKASSTTFLLRIGTDGQFSVMGFSRDSSFYAKQGYVNTAAFVHGDVNADGTITISDAIYLINHLFRNGVPPRPFETGDVNCDNQTSVSDVVYLINYLFRNGPLPCNL